MDQIRKSLLAACLRFLQPIVRVLLKGGVTYKEFSEVAKTAFVKVARDDYGLQGRKTNLTRVAILTGLSRKQCQHQRDLIEERGAEAPQTMNPASRVISKWHQDADFCDKAGRPLTLPFEGEKSVEALFRRYAGDIPSGALLKELRRVKAVEEVQDQGLRVIRRVFIPPEMDTEKIRILATQLFDLGSTINYNLTAEEGMTRMQRYVLNENIPEEAVYAFQELATEKGQELLEFLDEWLSNKEQDREKTKSKLIRTGLGIYIFEEPSEGEDL